MVWDGSRMQDSHTTSSFFWGKLFKQQILPKHLLLAPLLIGGGRGWQIFSSSGARGIHHGSNSCSAGPNRSSPALQGSPSTSSPIPQQHGSPPWLCHTTVVTVSMSAEATLEHARGKEDGTSGRKTQAVASDTPASLWLPRCSH